jgi:hypothetical protein
MKLPVPHKTEERAHFFVKSVSAVSFRNATLKATLNTYHAITTLLAARHTGWK